MSILVNIATIVVGVGIIIYVIGLIAKKRMSESQAVLWIAIALSAVILGIFPSVIPWIADKLGIWYAPSVLLLVATIGLLLILFRNSIVASGHTDEIHELAIQVALLQEENKALKTKIEEMERDCY